MIQRLMHFLTEEKVEDFLCKPVMLQTPRLYSHSLKRRCCREAKVSYIDCLHSPSVRKGMRRHLNSHFMHARKWIEPNSLKPTSSSILAYSWSFVLLAHKVRYKGLLLDCMMGWKSVFYTKQINLLSFKLKFKSFKYLFLAKYTESEVCLLLQWRQISDLFSDAACTTKTLLRICFPLFR